MKSQWMILAVALLALCACRAEDELEPGLVGEYFDLGEATEDFPTLAADKKPNLKRVDKTVNFEDTQEGFAGTEYSDHVYARWTGVIRIPKDATYTFFLNSDDGSRLWIDGKEFVNNGGQHPMEEKSGEVELRAGDHEIKIDFFENEGGAGCIASWQTEGVAKEVIPEKVLFHKKGTEK